MQGLASLVLPLGLAYLLNQKIDDKVKNDLPTLAFDAISGCTLDVVSKGNGVYKVTVNTSATTVTFGCTPTATYIPTVQIQGTAVDFNIASVDDTTRKIVYSLESPAASQAYVYWFKVN